MMIQSFIIAEDKPEICEAINVFVMVSANYQCKYTTLYSEEMPLIHILLKSIQSVFFFKKIWPPILVLFHSSPACITLHLSIK